MPIARQIKGKDVSLASEGFGRQGDPAVVLVMGATASMLGWPDEFCQELADTGRFVIRFDHRDTGQSTTLPPGQPAYSVEDLANDVIAVLDGWGVGTADVIGMSLGGYIAQVVALSNPNRLRSLTLFASEPLGWDGEPLPSIDPIFLDHFGQLAALDWQDRNAVTASMLETSRLCHVNMEKADESAVARTIERDLSRSGSIQSAFNHGMVALADDWQGKFRDIACRTLVLHGALDPILPPDNGRALAAGIPQAQYVEISGLGHAIPLSRLGEILAPVIAHLNHFALPPETQI